MYLPKPSACSGQVFGGLFLSTHSSLAHATSPLAWIWAAVPELAPQALLPHNPSQTSLFHPASRLTLFR